MINDAIPRSRHIDAGPGLPDLTRQLENLDQRWHLARAAGLPLSVLHLHIPQLKEIGRVFGNDVADEVLRQVVRRLEAWTRHKGALARIGEDALGLILDGTGEADAKAYAEALCHMIDGPFDVAGMAVVVQLRGGVASDGEGVDSPDLLFRQANAALSHELAGNDRVAIFAQRHQRAHADRLALMGDLCSAIERNELRLYCQPKVDLRTGRLEGAEALVRWLHPKLGLVPPAHFIRLAERTGMITRVTNWVLNAALGYLRGWQESGNARKLAINLSAQDIRDPAMARRIRNQMDAWGIRSGLLQFELTESALIADPLAALGTLTRLKDCGAEVLIDDYGIGYSSLSYLQQFPVDGIKIDQSFIAPMLRDADSAAIVRSTIELGHALGRQVIAEGVETPAVAYRLAEQGCDLAQGYLFSMPMPIEELPGWQDAWARSGGAGIQGSWADKGQAPRVG